MERRRGEGKWLSVGDKYVRSWEDGSYILGWNGVPLPVKHKHRKMAKYKRLESKKGGGKHKGKWLNMRN